MKQKPARKTGLLRLLSVLFALGVLTAGLGTGAKIYLDRSLDAMAEEAILRNEALADHPIRQALGADEIKAYVREFFPAVLRQDKTGLKPLVRKAQDLMIRNAPEDFRTYAMRDAAKYEDLLDRAAEAVLSDGAFTEKLREITEKTRTRLGVRWYLLEAALYSRPLTVAGAALSAAALLMWLLLGGVSAGMIKTGMLPALLLSAACAGAMLLAAGNLAPASPGAADAAALITALF